MIALTVSIAILAIIVALFIRQFSSAASGSGRTSARSGGKRPASTWGALLTGIIALVAVVTVFPDGQGVTISMALGALAAVTTLWAGFRMMADALYGLIGAVASVFLLREVFTWNSGQLWIAVLLLALFALTYAAAALLQVRSATVTLTDFPILGLQVFAGIELVLWLTSPLGAEIIGIPEGAQIFIFAIIVTVVIAAVSAKRSWSELVFGAASLAILAGHLLVQTLGYSLSEVNLRVTLITLVTFGVGFVLTMIALTLVRHRSIRNA